jgi:hypothetical protein
MFKVLFLPLWILIWLKRLLLEHALDIHIAVIALHGEVLDLAPPKLLIPLS